MVTSSFESICQIACKLQPQDKTQLRDSSAVRPAPLVAMWYNIFDLQPINSHPDRGTV